jgi:hypothetical protein
MEERRVKRWPGNLDGENQSLWKKTKESCVFSLFASLQLPGGLALSDYEEEKAMADSLVSQFQSLYDTSDPAFDETADEAMHACRYAPASDPTLTSPAEVLQVIRGLKFGKAPGPKGILRHILKDATALLTKLFNAVLRRQLLPIKHASQAHILNQGKGPRCLLTRDT